MPAMIDAICLEMKLQRSYTSKQSIETIYFGGGTPSMLESSGLEKIMTGLQQNFSIDTAAEITLEANPDDISTENLALWKTMGINRLSIGIQSFLDKDLKYLHRVHNAEKAIACLYLAKDAGFNNLTLDLIFGIPDLSDQDWLFNINTALDLRIPHISAYALTIEPRTALDLMIKKGKATPVDEQQSARQFEILMETMQARGYLHYEISNYCLPGHFAKHNTAYWKGETYLGLGPSAHSFNGKSRQWNVSGIKDYLDSVNNNILPAESETLTREQQYNEFVMTGLRTMWGCDIEVIKLKYGAQYAGYFSENMAPWLEIGCIEKIGSVVTLTQKGKLLADGIASDLFFI